MMNFIAGAKCLLDGKLEVTIVKAFNKLSTKYVVETPARVSSLWKLPGSRPLTRMLPDL